MVTEALNASNAANNPNASHQRAFMEAYTVSILESAMDAVITVDEHQTIILFNKAAEHVFRCPREQALGSSLLRFIPQRFQADHKEHMKRFSQENIYARRMSMQRIVMARRDDGEEFPIEASISHIHQNGKYFFTAILRDVTERVRAEEALRQSKEELQELALAAHSAREQEKTRIAREMHDELGQLLTALKMDVAWLKEKIAASKQDTLTLLNKLSAMQEVLNQTVAVTRRISSDLRPLVLDDLGLTAALEWVTQSFTEHSGVCCQLFMADLEELPLSDLQATAIFRIVQESLTNISKHAEASEVEVKITLTDQQLSLTIQDNGRGFLPDAPRHSNSYGLLGLKERSSLLGGTLHLASAPGQGTRIQITLPLSPQKETFLQQED